MLVATHKYTAVEIAKAIGVPTQRVATFKESPLFLTLVAEYERRFAVSASEAKLMDQEDIDKTVKVLREFRDGSIPDSPGFASLRLRATQSLFERQLPKPNAAAQSGGSKVVINIDTDRMETWKKLVDEGTGQVIDIEVEPNDTD
jgi:hypothetical protein